MTAKRPTRSKRCPACGDSATLWRGVIVSDWEAVAVDCEGGVTETTSHGYDRDVDWHDGGKTPDGTFGCSCGWEGSAAQLVVPPRIGVDGAPLPDVPPEQTTLPDP
jgi:hypothetical protein